VYVQSSSVEHAVSGVGLARGAEDAVATGADGEATALVDGDADVVAATAATVPASSTAPVTGALGSDAGEAPGPALDPPAHAAKPPMTDPITSTKVRLHTVRNIGPP
jgi:hypothetical protein